MATLGFYYFSCHSSQARPKGPALPCPVPPCTALVKHDWKERVWIPPAATRLQGLQPTSSAACPSLKDYHPRLPACGCAVQGGRPEVRHPRGSTWRLACSCAWCFWLLGAPTVPPLLPQCKYFFGSTCPEKQSSCFPSSGSWNKPSIPWE